MAESTIPLPELADIRQHEIQALFAAFSRRDWHAAETAANQMRDKFDRLLRTLAARAPAIAQGQGDDGLEVEAQAIYESWSNQPGYVPWVRRGNSDKQVDARQQALRNRAPSPAHQEPSHG